MFGMNNLLMLQERSQTEAALLPPESLISDCAAYELAKSTIIVGITGEVADVEQL